MQNTTDYLVEVLPLVMPMMSSM